MNENIIKNQASRRYEAMKSLMVDHNLHTKDLGPTFMNHKHQPISSIDYILLDEELFYNHVSLWKLDSCSSLVSDHYPIACQLKIRHDRKQQNSNIFTTENVKWHTVDVNIYKERVNDLLLGLNTDIKSVDDLTRTVIKVNTIMNDAARHAAPKKTIRRKNNRKPKIVSYNINLASIKCKSAFDKWKANGRSTDTNDTTYKLMKSTKNELRKICRKEQAIKNLNERQEIIDARTKHDSVFFKLLRRHKRKLKIVSQNLMYKIKYSELMKRLFKGGINILVR